MYVYVLVALPVLKKYYTRLHNCLPQDYVKTVNKLYQLIPDGITTDYLYRLEGFPSVELINEVIMTDVMIEIGTDVGTFVFCDIMDNLCEDTASKNCIQCLRNGMCLLL